VKRTVPVIVILSVVVCVSAGFVHAATPIWRLSQQARDAADLGEYARADKLFKKARRRAPENAYLAFGHATALARAGRVDDALVALDQAVTAGYRIERTLLRSEALESLHQASSWDAVVERVRANQVEYKVRLAEARQPIDPAEAPAFDDLEELLAEKQKANREFYGEKSDEPQQIRRARYIERWAASLIRLADEKPGDPQREQVLIELVRLRVGEAHGLELRWSPHAIETVQVAADRYLVNYAGSENAAEAWLAGAVARTVAPEPEDFLAPESDWPKPRCVETLPVFEELAAAVPADTWSLAALGFKGLCLAEAFPDRLDEIRAAAAAYLEKKEEEEESWGSYDLMLGAGLKIALWHIEGPPEFEAEALAGGTLTLADFKGRVTLLDFWNPG